MTALEAIAAMCRQCNYDELSAGTFLEQTAACACPNCPLYGKRPLPRGYRKFGAIDPEQVAAVRAKLERIMQERASR
ncbi:hypothetical protein ACU5AX_02910 [Sphingomonas sp. XXL09]|uniref:hypothetical protein n=1 Tax=Sphingomonas sp. XXL09 TaxID=3457787 RepID=UPI00406BB224